MAARHPDPIAIAPSVYRVLFENDQVRMLEVAMQPGEASAMHFHPDSVVYVLTGGKADPAAGWGAVFRSRPVWVLLAAKALTDSVWYFYLFWFAKYLQAERGFGLNDIAWTGVVFLAADAGCLLGGWLSGRLIRRGRDPVRARLTVMAGAAAVLALIIANAISISVRERQKEFAVMKVLGFRPNQLLALVLGESLVLGTLAGFTSAFATYFIVNKVFGGIPFPIAFFGRFFIPGEAIYWGPLIGVGTSFLGSFMPAWSARSVRVSDVFARVT